MTVAHGWDAATQTSWCLTAVTLQQRGSKRLVKTERVEEIYRTIAPVYDLLCGPLLQPGRKLAMVRLAPRAGERILEIGVGTGFALRTYPARCHVVGVDLSARMIARADTRRRRDCLAHVRLCRMDGAALAFADGSFDAVYAPYVINVVPNPVAVAREMLRVCRPGGRLVFLNHFDHQRRDTLPDRFVGIAAATLTGVNWRLSFSDLVRDSRLDVVSVDAVNLGNVSSVVLCRT
jgi:phosphatidylethanolamine/phosphatidyl-N-methylethanolamine N-methyltransferase